MTKPAPALYFPPLSNSCDMQGLQAPWLGRQHRGRSGHICAHGRPMQAFAQDARAQNAAAKVKLWSWRPRCALWEVALLLLQAPLLRLSLDVGIECRRWHVAIEISTKVTVHLCSADEGQPERWHRRGQAHRTSKQAELLQLHEGIQPLCLHPQHAKRRNFGWAI